MNSPNINSPADGSAPRLALWTAVTVAVALGLSLASIDILFVFFDSPDSWSAINEIAPAFAVTALLAAVASTALWFLVAAPLGRRYGLDPAAFLVTYAGFLAAGFTLLMAVREEFHVFEGFAALALAGSVAGCVYPAVRNLQRRGGSPPLALKLALALPLVLMVILTNDWMGQDRLLYADGETILGAMQPLFLLGGLFVATLAAFLLRPAVYSKLLAGVFAVVVVFGFWQLAGRTDFVTVNGGATSEGAHEVPRVLLLSVDTLRADALSVYNLDAGPTPHIDALAAESVVFDHAYASGSWTLPSVASMITGLPTFAHHLSGNPLTARLPDEIPTLAESMRAAGYRTAAIVENIVLAPRLNYYKGFDEYAHFPKLWTSTDSIGRTLLRQAVPAKYRQFGTEVLTECATQWLRANHEEDFFLWLHYFDPHSPYSPPDEYQPQGTPPPLIGRSFELHDNVRAGLPLTAEDRQWIKQLYLGEVRYVDDRVGKVIAELKRLGLYDDAMIVFTSDHGEEFWEHGGYEHGHTLYDEVVRVPLMVKLPRAAKTGRLSEPVSNRLIMSTVLEQCGLEQPSKCYRAPSLAALWNAGDCPASNGAPRIGAEKRAVLSAGTHYFQDQSSVIVDGHKLIRYAASKTEEFFDLASDPGETASVLEQKPEAAALARRILEAKREEYELIRACYRPSGRQTRQADPEAVKRLKSLGYVR